MRSSKPASHVMIPDIKRPKEDTVSKRIPGVRHDGAVSPSMAAMEAQVCERAPRIDSTQINRYMMLN